MRGARERRHARHGTRGVERGGPHGNAPLPFQYIRAFRWGRGVRRAVGRWYTAKPALAIAYQICKYQARDGWAHRDALRLAHPKAPTGGHDVLFRYATKGWRSLATAGKARTAEWELDGVKDPDVVALIGAITSLAHLAPNEAATVISGRKLTREMIPTGLLALDVSGSMGSPVFGMDYLTCREASAAMALVLAATEPDHRFVAFTKRGHPSRADRGQAGGGGDGVERIQHR